VSIDNWLVKRALKAGRRRAEQLHSRQRAPSTCLRADEVNLWVAHLPLPKVRLTSDEYDAAFLKGLQETLRRMTREVSGRAGRRGKGRKGDG
jgi:hypothetical protein